MSVYTLLRNFSQPTMSQMESAVAGNLCRCTGYRPILDGLRKLTKEYSNETRTARDKHQSVHRGSGEVLEESARKISGLVDTNLTAEQHDNTCQNKSWADCPMGDKCCKNKIVSVNSEHQPHPPSQSANKHDSQEFIFPSELSLHSETYRGEFLRFTSERQTWYRPVTHEQLLKVWRIFPQALLVAGNTDLALQHKQGGTADNLILISTTQVREYKRVRLSDDGIYLGAGLTLSEVHDVLTSAIESCPASKVRGIIALVEMLVLVGSKQIRDVATLGGHIVAASPVSDLNPILQVTGSTVIVTSPHGLERNIKLDDQFFTGNKQTRLEQCEIITDVCVPFSKEMEYIAAYKESRKKTDTISNVTSAMRVKFKYNSMTVEQTAVSFSGLETRTRLAIRTSNRLTRLEWNDDLLAQGLKELEEELHLPEKSVGGRVEFRNILVGSMFFKFYLTVSLQLQQQLAVNPLPPGCPSAVTKLSCPIRSSCQIYERVEEAESTVNIASPGNESSVVDSDQRHVLGPFVSSLGQNTDNEKGTGRETDCSTVDKKVSSNNVTISKQLNDAYKNSEMEKVHHKDRLESDKDKSNELKGSVSYVKATDSISKRDAKASTQTEGMKNIGGNDCNQHACINEVSAKKINNQDSFKDPVGQPLANVAARLHATGEALYIDDLPPYRNELHLALVISDRAHADIISVDTSAALKIPGVVDYIDHRDVPGANIRGIKTKDEEIFRVNKVTCEGQAIGAIVAESKAIARRAARAVVIEYRDLEPILTIQQAIQRNSYLETSRRALSRGNVDEAFEGSDHVIEGAYEVGGQKHFYMENQTCLVVTRKENREVDIYSSTQALTTLQASLAEALNIDYNKITCRVKRIGGGFGGKENNSLLVALPAAVASYKLNRPVRCMLDRDEDMIIAGGRNPFLIKYKVGFSATGMLQAVDTQLYCNGGYSYDLSEEILETAITNIENSYYVPNIRAEGYVCRTNLPSNTAFRGFGAPQAVLTCEHWISEIVDFLGVSATEIREMNLYRDGDLTPYNQEIVNCPVRRCWQQVFQDSNYAERKVAVEEFNATNRWKKRGLAVTPVKVGVNTAVFKDQAGALIHIYLDGSVLLTHGGVEMGQGLHTKMIQVASKALQIPTSKIYTSETNIATVPNTPPTSASASSDLNGMAILNACETLMKRLEPFRQANPTGSWKDWVNQAFMAMTSLSATGFYKIPDLTYSWETNTGRKYSHFTTGASCSEVEIDCLTGEHTILRTDIVMDVGRSLNPAIDIGQIEGAFIQGYGYYMLEEVIYSSEGNIQNKGTLDYRIPAIFDIPAVFNVALLKGSRNSRCLHSSKGIGEPPLLLATSVFMAVRDAIKSAHRDSGMSERFISTLKCPATIEHIRLALPRLVH